MTASAVYLLNAVTLLAGLALFFFSTPQLLPIPAAARLAFGAGLTPFVAGAFVILLTALLPGVPVKVLGWASGLCGAGLIALYRDNLPALRRRVVRRLRKPEIDEVVVIGVLAVLVVMVSARLVFYVQQPASNADDLQYLAQARNLLLHRSFYQMPGVGGLADGSLRGDVHGPLWPALLASAMALGIEDGRIVTHVPARLACQLLVPVLVAAVVATVLATRLRHIVWIAILTVACIPLIGGVSIQGDREAFRLTALLLLLTYLMAHTRLGGLGRRSLPVLALGVVLGACAMQGHGLSLVFVPITVAMWVVVALVAQLSIGRIAALAGAVAVGTAIGAAQIVQPLLATGSVMGDNVTMDRQVQGTVYERGRDASEALRIGDGHNILARAKVTFGRDRGYPSVAGILAFLGFAGAWWSQGRGRRLHLSLPQARLATLNGWFFVQSLVLLGAFDVGHYKLGAWTVLNSRYALQWYLAAALVTSCGLAILLARARREFKPFAMYAAAGLAVLLGVWTIDRVGRSWPFYDTSVTLKFAGVLNEIARPLPQSCRILAEDTSVNYHAEREVIQLYSKAQRHLFQAQTPSEVNQSLRRDNLCVVTIYKGLYMDKAGPDTPIQRLLESPAYVRKDYVSWKVYVRADLMQ